MTRAQNYTWSNAANMQTAPVGFNSNLMKIRAFDPASTVFSPAAHPLTAFSLCKAWSCSMMDCAGPVVRRPC